MKLTIPLLILAVISQSIAAKKSIKSKKTEKGDKRALEDNNYGDRIDSKGHSQYANIEPEEDLAESPHIDSPHHYGKVSDILNEDHYHDALSSQLHSPVSPYHHRFGVPGYEISAPIPSELAYSAHEIHRPTSSKKYKKKGQSKHTYHEEEPKEYHIPNAPHLLALPHAHFSSYPHEYPHLRNLYAQYPHHLYAERPLVSPHHVYPERALGGYPQLHHGVSSFVRPIVPQVLGQQVIRQVGIPHPIVYTHRIVPYTHETAPYPQGYVQPVQYTQQQLQVEHVIPRVTYGQESEIQDQQREVQAAQARGPQAVLQFQHPAQQQYQQFQVQQSQLQPQIETQQLPPQQYPQQQLQQVIQPQETQAQEQNVQLEPEQTQGAVSYASFSQSLPQNYPQNQALGQQSQSTQTVSQFNQNQNYQIYPEASQPTFQIQSTTQNSHQQEFSRLQPLLNSQTTDLPPTGSNFRTLNNGYLPTFTNSDVNVAESRSQIQRQTSESPLLESSASSVNIYTTIRPEVTEQSTLSSQSTHATSQLASSSPIPTSTSQPNTESYNLSDTDQDLELLQQLSSDPPSVYSQEQVIQQPGIPGADVQYFGNYAGSLLRHFRP